MPDQPHTNLFDQVDRSGDPDFFIRFMDEAQKPAAIARSKQVILNRIALTPGDAVLEVGCGPGSDVFDMVDLVGPTGHLVGIDASEVMIAEARRRVEHRGVSVTFEVGDVQAVPYPDARFDVCRAARCLNICPTRGAHSQRWFG
jgi:ubiquinone/menaquinone biosynthesis C-methylase UbiE